jgi:hypothetical protein
VLPGLSSLPPKRKNDRTVYHDVKEQFVDAKIEKPGLNPDKYLIRNFEKN